MNFVYRAPNREALIWQRIFRGVRLSRESAMVVTRRSRRNNVSLAEELLASGRVSGERFAQIVAIELGVPFLPDIAPEDIVASEDQCIALLSRKHNLPPVRLIGPDGRARIAVPTDRVRLALLRRMIERRRDLRQRLVVASPLALRSAIAQKARLSLARLACMRLAESWPELSARTILAARQAMIFGALAIVAPVAFWAAPSLALVVTHAAFSLSFLACVFLRAWATAGAAPPRLAPINLVDPARLPVCSVLVALYHEADMVPELMVSLGRLNWPRSKLEVKLVCEEDDTATLSAIEALPRRPHVEIVRVPRLGPRTKPKALAYGLPWTSGEVVVLYDAEDRPHPDQLLEAWQRFEREDDDLACLQAPLSISNSRESLVSRAFAFEYAALFRGLLPQLAAHSLVLPLGGTSNVFRRRALEEVGGWDPYNVTEDADLGMRLARFGYRTGVITRPTFEDAPVDWSVWLPQRTRWLKGYLTTWLVHMRHPGQWLAEVGPASFAVAQILFAGMVASALVHPLFLATLVWLGVWYAAGLPFSTHHSALFIIDSVNISLGYLAFFLLGRQTLLPRERASAWKIAAFLPVYWLMISVAAWRALFQLVYSPHVWEKTTHRPRSAMRKRSPSDRGGGVNAEAPTSPSPRISGLPR